MRRLLAIPFSLVLVCGAFSAIFTHVHEAEPHQHSGAVVHAHLKLHAGVIAASGHGTGIDDCDPPAIYLDQCCVQPDSPDFIPVLTAATLAEIQFRPGRVAHIPDILIGRGPPDTHHFGLRSPPSQPSA